MLDLASRSDAPGETQAGRHASATATIGTAHGFRSDVAQTVPAQVAAAIARAAAEGQRSIELRLSPEELGPVRLRLETAGDGLTVSVVVERGETLDLMRRNVDLLTQQLREIGYDHARLLFSRSGADAGGHAAPGSGAATSAVTGADAADDPHGLQPVLVVLGDRLDIRL